MGATTMGIPNLTRDDIPWALEPLPRLEDTDPLTLSTFELLAHHADLQSECRWLRRLLHEALAMVARQTDQLARSARTVDALRRELRALREDAAA
jgi:hypothetical protein